MNNKVQSGFDVVLSSRDLATADIRARDADSFMRTANSYIQSFAMYKPKTFARMPALQIEYICQLAYEGRSEEGLSSRSKKLEEALGLETVLTLHTHAYSFIRSLEHISGARVDPITRKTITREILLYHIKRFRANEHNKSSPGNQRRHHIFHNGDNFGVVIPKNKIKNLTYDPVTNTSRFRCLYFSDAIKIEGIDLITRKWHHLLLTTPKTWGCELSNWKLVIRTSNLMYVRDKIR